MNRANFVRPYVLNLHSLGVCCGSQAIWDHAGTERKGKPPGSMDDYRETVYKRCYNQSFEVLRSALDYRCAEANVATPIN
jgi:hypothetical protein